MNSDNNAHAPVAVAENSVSRVECSMSSMTPTKLSAAAPVAWRRRLLDLFSEQAVINQTPSIRPQCTLDHITISSAVIMDNAADAMSIPGSIQSSMSANQPWEERHL